MEFLTRRLTFIFIIISLIGCASAPKEKKQAEQIASFDSGLILQEGEDGVMELVFPEMVEYDEVTKEAEEQAQLEKMELGSEAPVDDTEDVKEELSTPLSSVLNEELKPEIDLRRDGISGKPDTPKISAPVAAPVAKTVAPAPVEDGDGYDIYVVQRRDTLHKISMKIYNSKDRWQDIVQWNAKTFNRDRSLKVGQRLKYYKGERVSKAGVEYTIQKGDSLQKISRRFYGGTNKHWPAIWEHNRSVITDPNNIKPGFTIFTPAMEDIRKQEEERKRNPYKWRPVSRSISGEPTR